MAPSSQKLEPPAIPGRFTVPGAEPAETMEVADRRRTKLLIWRF